MLQRKEQVGEFHGLWGLQACVGLDYRAKGRMVFLIGRAVAAAHQQAQELREEQDAGG